MSAGAATVSILMYHSIASGPGPLAIPPEIFRSQLDTLAECGFRGVALRDYLAVRSGPSNPRERIAVLTFDDGYRDFSDVVVPEVLRRGWSCTVFLSSGLVGGADGWDPDGRGRRQLIDWPRAHEAAAAGVELGGHGVTHTDLTRLVPEQAEREIAASKDEIERRAQCRVTSFAAPFGRTTPEVRARIARHYECAVGTALGQAHPDDDRYNLPRIEMWYFRSPARWRAFLHGAVGYVRIRQALRRARIATGLERWAR